MKWRGYNLFSHSLFFLLALIVFSVFWFPKSAEAVCANTTTFDPNEKVTFLTPIGNLSYSVNIQPFNYPSLPTWNFEIGQHDVPVEVPISLPNNPPRSYTAYYQVLDYRPGTMSWYVRDNCTPITAASTATILPTTYSFNAGNVIARQGYRANASGDYLATEIITPYIDLMTNVAYPPPPYPLLNPLPIYSGSENIFSCGGEWCQSSGGLSYDARRPPNNEAIIQDNKGYGVSASVPALSAINFSTITIQQMITEDAIINRIATAGTIGVKVDTPAIGASHTFNIPATNCVKLSGDGPRKVVFMRGKSWNSSVGDFLAGVNSVINNGFKTIDPFKTYQDQFSFYVDLKKYDDTASPLVNSGDYIFFDSDINSNLIDQSSCASITGQADTYLFYHGRPSVYVAYAHLLKPVAFFNTLHMSILDTPGVYTAIHEVGHAFAKLFDEYLYSLQGSLWNQANSTGRSSLENCSIKPSWSYRNTTDNNIYGGVSNVGCAYMQSPEVPPKDRLTFYRPSVDGIMNNTPTNPESWNRFNIISCGYIVSAIKGEALTQANAQKHWPAVDPSGPGGKGCSVMDTIKDKMPPRSPTAALTIPVNNRVSPGFTALISGSNFTSTDNAAQFTNTATRVFYETLGIPSNGSTLSFAVPLDAPPGNYTLKVGAFNSDWSNSVPFTITNIRTPVLSLTAIPSSVPLGKQVTITWLAQGASTCTGDTNMDKPPELWANPDLSGSLTLSIADSATFSLTCTGPGGTVSKNVAVAITSPLPPTVSITATASNVVVGSGVTIAWSTSDASSCRGSGTGDSATLSAWSKAQPTTGFLYLAPTVNAFLTLTCSGLGGSRSDTYPIFVTTPPTPPSTPLSVSCSVTPQTTVRRNELATYTANATGGNGSYIYSWAGTDALIGNAPQASKFYTSSGTKTASVTVSSSGQNQTAQCPSVQYDSSLNAPTVAWGDSFFQSLSPASGPSGTMVTVVGRGDYGGTTNFESGASTVVIRNGGATLYVRPTSIFYSASPMPPYSTFANLRFTFRPSLPLPTPVNGMAYSVSVMNNYASGLAEGIAQTFTLSASQPPTTLPTPSITSLTPSSGPVNTSIALTGSNFTQDTKVIVTRKTSTSVVNPIFVSASSLKFTFSPTFVEVGDYIIKVSNQGVISNAVTFSNTTPTPVPTSPPVKKLVPPVLKLEMSFFQGFVASVLKGFGLLFGW